ncbi:MAG: TonB-dependent receptor, partial [Pseudomonadales bacterium]|nr:TonB-dependent receptor [Pseudomonadales bacterium]
MNLSDSTWKLLSGLWLVTGSSWIHAAVVEGVVNDALGRPLAKVSVAIKVPGHKAVVGSTTTDSQGHFSFAGLAPGQYQVSATDATYQAGSARVSLQADNDHRQTLLTLNSTQALRVHVKVRHKQHVRNQVSKETGTSTYQFTQKDIDKLPDGSNTSFNQVLLQAPGVVQDSYGQLHVRGDHADLQYRINGIMLPDSIAGFGQSLDTHFAHSIQLLTGALPAQYGYHTAGVVDIRTQSGAFAQGGSLGAEVGSYGEQTVFGDVAGHSGRLNYYLGGSLMRSDIGIENPVNNKNPQHDQTHQGKAFGYFSYLIDDVSSVSLIFGTTNNRFQIPTISGEVAPYQVQGGTGLASAQLNDQQRETTHYLIATYQGAVGDRWNYQVSLFSRYTDVNFQPDVTGDLAYTGVSSAVVRSGWTNGIQSDATYRLDEHHTLRMGTYLSTEKLVDNSQLQALPGNVMVSPPTQASTVPVAFGSYSSQLASTEGIYLQDEWKLTRKLTVNYGARLDAIQAYVQGDQLSPRLNMLYQLAADTTAHIGYSRYFTPPPTDQIMTATIASSQGTLAAPTNDQNNTVKPERSNYYDAGIDQQITSKFTVGVDSYYQQIQNLLDEGQFGSALIYTPFNYQYGKIYGVEFTSNYRDDNFSAYLNVARSTAMGKNITSSQYVFAPDELNYISNHWTHLDHDQTWTASGGLTYSAWDTNYTLDVLAGTGLRNGFANQGHMPGYMQVNVSADRTFIMQGLGKLDGRVGITNLLDRAYELRDGTGVGVG